MVKAVCRWYAHLFIGRRWYVKILSGVLSFIIFSLVYFGMVDINFLGLFGQSPGFYEISNPPSNSASEVFSKDGKTIGKFYNENRSPVKYEDVAPVFWDALVDTEDERFFHHRGIDFQGVLGAIKDAIVRRDPRGASTITQQLAKNMFRMRTQTTDGLLSDIPGLRMLIVKSKEWIIATKIEMVYDKQEILTMYANTVDFGSNCYGIKTACKTYFNITPAELTTDQSAVLVGILKATSRYNPIINPENSHQRRNVVMSLMVKNKHLSESEYQKLAGTPTPLNFHSDTGTNGQSAYFKDAVEASLEKWCHETGYDLYTSGLKIYTTLDTDLQAYAENALIGQMEKLQASFNVDWGKDEPWRDEKGKVIPHFIEKMAKKLPEYEMLKKKYDGNTDSIDYYLNKPHPVTLFDYKRGTYEAEMSTLDSLRTMLRFLHAGMVVMEPQTGAVLAWVGDINYMTWKYDKVTAMRQPGSTFKLFVYTEAMNQGLAPCDKRRDEAVNVPIYDGKTHSESLWSPTNASKSFSGDSMLLKRAFATSVNSIAVRLGVEMGVKNVINTAHAMGVKSELDTHPSTLLGASDVNLLEMVNAYCTIANDGLRHEPVLVTRILDSEDNLIYQGPEDSPRAIPYKSAFMMQQMLMNAVDEGTSRRLKPYVERYTDTDIGGKTGTSNNVADGWYIAVTPGLVCGAWVGGEYRQIHFRSGKLGQGAATALPICGNFLKWVLRDPDYKKYHKCFEVPPGEDVNYDLFICTPKPSQAPPPAAIAPTEENDMLDEENSDTPTDENANGSTRETEIYVPERDDDIFF
jgi:penicillin-binding protein 1A